ncbi:MAG: hypothetical protein SP1CHLAM54_00280 [Chlamydiia bacterium]|nr:hypothetical protein [Chlamydiia bacterium]MCH9614950.1 hypothetical protein [Chlamydiia bacterium]MCH9630000.1 hypothetical protein [Chlamydiia bacterium]
MALTLPYPAYVQKCEFDAQNLAQLQHTHISFENEVEPLSRSHLLNPLCQRIFPLRRLAYKAQECAKRVQLLLLFSQSTLNKAFLHEADAKAHASIDITALRTALVKHSVRKDATPTPSVVLVKGEDSLRRTYVKTLRLAQQKLKQEIDTLLGYHQDYLNTLYDIFYARGSFDCPLLSSEVRQIASLFNVRQYIACFNPFPDMSTRSRQRYQEVFERGLEVLQACSNFAELSDALWKIEADAFFCEPRSQAMIDHRNFKYERNLALKAATKTLQRLQHYPITVLKNHYPRWCELEKAVVVMLPHFEQCRTHLEQCCTHHDVISLKILIKAVTTLADLHLCLLKEIGASAAHNTATLDFPIPTKDILPFLIGYIEVITVPADKVPLCSQRLVRYLGAISTRVESISLSRLQGALRLLTS